MAYQVYEPVLSNPTILVGNAPVDSTVTTVQNLTILAPPASTSAPTFYNNFVVTDLIVRNISATALVGANISMGWTSTSGTTAASGIFSAVTTAATLAAGAQVKIPAAAGTLMGTPGQFLNISLAAGTASSALRVEVVGYFVATA
jgi:hypothetical protein